MLPDPSGLPASTPHVASDLSACLTAIGLALEAGFQPRAFLQNLSTALAPLVPHDRLGIGYLSDDRRTFLVFAEHGASVFLPETNHYTADLERSSALSDRRLTARRSEPLNLGNRTNMMLGSLEAGLDFSNASAGVVHAMSNDALF